MKKICIFLLLFTMIFTTLWADEDIRRIKLEVTGPYANEIYQKIYHTKPKDFIWYNENDYLKNMTIYVNCHATRNFNNNSSSYGRNGGGGFSVSGTELYFDVTAVDNEGNRQTITPNLNGCYWNYSENSTVRIGNYTSQNNTQTLLNIDRLIKILNNWTPPYLPPIVCISISDEDYLKYQPYCKENTMWYIKRNNIILATCPLFKFYQIEGKRAILFRPKLSEVDQKLFKSTTGINVMPVGAE